LDVLGQEMRPGEGVVAGGANAKLMMTTAMNPPLAGEDKDLLVRATGWRNPPTAIKWLFVADVTVALMAVAAHAVSVLLKFDKIDLFRLGQENNIPTWYSSSQLLVVGLALMLFAHRRSQRMGWFDWRLALPPMFLLLLSLDETASLHERMGEGLETLLASMNTGTGMRVGTWTLICGPLFLIGLWLLARLTKPIWHSYRPVARKFAVGFALLFVSAVGGELIMSAVPADSIAEKAETFFEELGEMVAVTIMLWAAWDLLLMERYAAITASGESTDGDSDAEPAPAMG